MTGLPPQPQTALQTGSQSLDSSGPKSPWPPVNSPRCFSEVTHTPAHTDMLFLSWLWGFFIYIYLNLFIYWIFYWIFHRVVTAYKWYIAQKCKNMEGRKQLSPQLQGQGKYHRSFLFLFLRFKQNLHQWVKYVSQKKVPRGGAIICISFKSVKRRFLRLQPQPLHLSILSSSEVQLFSSVSQNNSGSSDQTSHNNRKFTFWYIWCLRSVSQSTQCRNQGNHWARPAAQNLHHFDPKWSHECAFPYTM